jgi:hypothetical protein
MQQLQSTFQTRVQRVLRRDLFARLGIRLEERLGSLDEDVAQIVQEERVRSVGSLGEVSGL